MEADIAAPPFRQYPEQMRAMDDLPILQTGEAQKDTNHLPGPIAGRQQDAAVAEVGDQGMGRHGLELTARPHRMIDGLPLLDLGQRSDFVNREPAVIHAAGGNRLRERTFHAIQCSVPGRQGGSYSAPPCYRGRRAAPKRPGSRVGAATSAPMVAITAA